MYRGVCCVCQVADRGYHAGGRHYQQRKELSDLKADNDAYYNTTVASEDLEAVKEAAQNRLGMKYADESQVIYFDDSENSYVRQYQDVPDAK